MTCSLGDLAFFDRSNLTGSYHLHLSRPVDRAVAARLQLAALQECAAPEGDAKRSGGSTGAWLAVKLDGAAVPDAALSKLQQYALPPRGVLELNYVSCQVRH